MIKVISLLLFSFFSASLLSSESNQRGYWWGEKVEIKEDNEDEYKAPPPLPPFEDIMKMHPKKIKQMEEDYRDYAVWKRTPEAAAQYWTLVDAIRKQARGFMAVSSYSMLQNPHLDYKNDNPTTNAGRKATRTKNDKEILSKLHKERENFALIMFTQPNCTYCKTQSSSLKFFSKETYWKVKEIDITKYPSFAADYNINQVPVTIILKKSNKDWLPIANGVESVPVIKNNVYRSIRLMNNEIDPIEFYTPEHMKEGFFDPTHQGKNTFSPPTE